MPRALIKVAETRLRTPGPTEAAFGMKDGGSENTRDTRGRNADGTPPRP
jgi:hypothetical protein